MKYISLLGVIGAITGWLLLVLSAFGIFPNKLIIVNIILLLWAPATGWGASNMYRTAVKYYAS